MIRKGVDGPKICLYHSEMPDALFHYAIDNEKKKTHKNLEGIFNCLRVPYIEQGKYICFEDWITSLLKGFELKKEISLIMEICTSNISLEEIKNRQVCPQFCINYKLI